ncbi:hypothetical protein BDY24DRAFT_399978 [Mrakia frigida]|uniref:uncharacterized protein n=1 Tax=Mrakia frigida TaxID=29902 RepID=UPI003FCC03BE
MEVQSRHSLNVTSDRPTSEDSNEYRSFVSNSHSRNVIGFGLGLGSEDVPDSNGGVARGGGEDVRKLVVEFQSIDLLPMPSKNPEPLGAILPSDARQAPDVDQVALARESDEGDESNRIVRPAERIESSLLLGRRELCDHVDKLMRFVVSYSKEGDSVGRDDGYHSAPVVYESFPSFVQWRDRNLGDVATLESFRGPGSEGDEAEGVGLGTCKGSMDLVGVSHLRKGLGGGGAHRGGEGRRRGEVMESESRQPRG